MPQRSRRAKRPLSVVALLLAAGIFAYTMIGGGTSSDGPVDTYEALLGYTDDSQQADQQLNQPQSPSGTGLATSEGAPPPPTAAEAGSQLSTLEVAPEGSMSGYSRESFPHWASDGTEFGWAEPDGSCDVRDDALIRDGQGVQINEHCTITAGSWTGPYTGDSLDDDSDLDIDHIVPLANAYRSGADSWTESRKEAYASDPGVLLSTGDSANQEKSDSGPEDWTPPNTLYHCEYAKRWIGLKSAWGLTVTTEERSELEGLLQTCRG